MVAFTTNCPQLLDMVCSLYIEIVSDMKYTDEKKQTKHTLKERVKDTVKGVKEKVTGFIFRPGRANAVTSRALITRTAGGNRQFSKKKGVRGNTTAKIIGGGRIKVRRNGIVKKIRKSHIEDGDEVLDKRSTYNITRGTRVINVRYDDLEDGDVLFDEFTRKLVAAADDGFAHMSDSDSALSDEDPRLMVKLAARCSDEKKMEELMEWIRDRAVEEEEDSASEASNNVAQRAPVETEHQRKIRELREQTEVILAEKTLLEARNALKKESIITGYLEDIGLNLEEWTMCGFRAIFDAGTMGLLTTLGTRGLIEILSIIEKYIRYKSHQAVEAVGEAATAVGEAVGEAASVVGEAAVDAANTARDNSAIINEGADLLFNIGATLDWGIGGLFGGVNSLFSSGSKVLEEASLDNETCSLIEIDNNATVEETAHALNNITAEVLQNITDMATNASSLFDERSFEESESAPTAGLYQRLRQFFWNMNITGSLYNFFCSPIGILVGLVFVAKFSYYVHQENKEKKRLRQKVSLQQAATDTHAELDQQEKDQAESNKRTLGVLLDVAGTMVSGGTLPLLRLLQRETKPSRDAVDELDELLSPQKPKKSSSHRKAIADRATIDQLVGFLQDEKSKGSQRKMVAGGGGVLTKAASKLRKERLTKEKYLRLSNPECVLPSAAESCLDHDRRRMVSISENVSELCGKSLPLSAINLSQADEMRHRGPRLELMAMPAESVVCTSNFVSDMEQLVKLQAALTKPDGNLYKKEELAGDDEKIEQLRELKRILKRLRKQSDK
jgi:hypothetical protein